VYVYTHIRVAHFRFQIIHLPHGDRVAQVAQAAFWAERASVLLELHLLRCASTTSADTELRNDGNEGLVQFDILEALLGVFICQLTPVYALETQLPTSSRLGHWWEVS
jgi:hypothetical protein